MFFFNILFFYIIEGMPFKLSSLSDTPLTENHLEIFKKVKCGLVADRKSRTALKIVTVSIKFY